MNSIAPNTIQPMKSAPVEQEKNPKLLQAAQMYENQFLREMVRSMRKTVNESELLPTSMGEKIFREQLDDQYVDQWVSKGGVGLSDLIYNQIVDRYGQALGIKNNQQLTPQKGPLPLDTKQNIKINKKSGDNSDTFSFYINNQLDKKSLEILSPWSGRVQSSFESPDGMKVVRVDHDNGVESTLAFHGATEEIAPETRLSPGDKVGRFMGEKPLIWSIKYSRAG